MLGDILRIIIEWVIYPLIYIGLVWLTISVCLRSPWSNNRAKAIVFYVIFFGVGWGGAYLYFQREIPWFVPIVGISAIWWPVFDDLLKERKPDSDRT